MLIKYFTGVGHEGEIEKDVNIFLNEIGNRFVDIKFTEVNDTNFYCRSIIVVYKELIND